MNKVLSPEDYLAQKKVQDILEGIVLSLLEVRPEDVENHIINYLMNRKAINSTMPPEGKKMELFPSYSGGTVQSTATAIKQGAAQGRRRSEINPAVLSRTNVRRMAMSSKMNSNTEFEIRYIKKDAQTFQEIESIIKSIDLFSLLHDDQRKSLIGAMFEKKYKAGDAIIVQGDRPDNFYIIQDGLCTIKKKDQTGKIVFTTQIGKGRYFGELALITGATRAASIYADTDVTTWAVDQETYRALLKEQHTKKRQLYKSILQKVPLLADLEDYQILLIADALHPVTPAAGEEIVKQGAHGDTFYIILEGECTVSINGKVVNKLGQNQYFGEIALMNDSPRAATVTAGQNVKLVTLDRPSFTRLLPMCNRIFQDNMKKYKGTSSD